MGKVVDLDLGELFQQAFGKETQAFNPQLAQVEGDIPGSRVDNAVLRGAPYYAKDLNLGVEYFMPVTITYPEQSSTPVGLQNGNTNQKLKTWNLPFPVISISSTKRIIETPMTESYGSVAELITISGYTIKIHGFIVSPTDDFPEADIVTLRDIYEINEAISIKSPLTDIFLMHPGSNGCDSVVIKSLSLPELKGVKNVKPYELEFISDTITDLLSIGTPIVRPQLFKLKK